MLNLTSTFSTFAVDDLSKAKAFYLDKLSLSINEEDEMGFSPLLPDGHKTFIYPKSDHQPAIFTVLNFVVEDIDEAVEELKEKGIDLLFYNREDLPQDEKGVFRGLSEDMGPDIAWFEDPSGNILAILQES